MRMKLFRVVSLFCWVILMTAFMSCSNSTDTEKPESTEIQTLAAGEGGEFYPFDEPPKLLKFRRPEYPPGVQEKINAGVLVKVTIDERGEVEDSRILQSTDPRFEKSAIEALKHFKFQSAKLNGKPTKCIVAVPIRFKQ